MTIENYKSKKGKPLSEEHKKNMIESLRNPEVREKISNSLKGSSNAAGRKFKGYYILFTNPEGEEIKIDSGFNKFCADNNISRRSMTRFLKNEYKGESVNGWKGKKIYE